MAFKYVSEMTPAELDQVVFGEGFQRDAKGRPIEQGLLSNAHIRSGKNLGSIAGHLEAIAKYDKDHGTERRARELDRIQSIRRAAGLPPLDLSDDL